MTQRGGTTEIWRIKHISFNKIKRILKYNHFFCICSIENSFYAIYSDNSLASHNSRSLPMQQNLWVYLNGIANYTLGPVLDWQTCKQKRTEKNQTFMLVAMYLMFVCSFATIIIQVMITNICQVQMEGIIWTSVVLGTLRNIGQDSF